MPAYSTTDFLTAVRRLAYLPDAGDIDATEILSRADDEMVTIIADAVKAGREGFWLTSEDITLLPDTRAYQMPRRALGRGVVGVQMVNSQGTAFTIPQIDPVTGWNGRTTAITSYCYSFQADKLVFPTAPPSNYLLRVLYLRRPSRLVEVSEGAAIVSAANSTQLAVTDVPTWMAAINSDLPPLYVDIIRGDASFDQPYVDLLAIDYNAGLGALTLGSDIDTALFVDTDAISNDRVDYVCKRDETVYPVLPLELIPVLEAAVSMRILESLKDAQGAEMMGATLMQRKRAAVDIIEPRNQEGSRPIVRIRSPLRQTFGIGRRWR